MRFEGSEPIEIVRSEGLAADTDAVLTPSLGRPEPKSRFCGILRPVSRAGGLEETRMAHPIRILLAKVGLDGHDRGVKVVARTLRDAGMDVVYSGLHRTPEEVVNAAVQEDVDVLGVSLLSGVQMTVFPKIFSLLKEKGVDDMIVVAGGVMPDEDVAELKKMGVAEIMLQDTPPQAIVDRLTRLVEERGAR
jgi:methylmalonyl-CoA mutase cobalamin-binding domain/chain